MLQQLNTLSTNRTVCLDLFAIYIMLSMSVKTNLHITVRKCQTERNKIHLTTVGCYQRESCIETIFLTLTGELYISGVLQNDFYQSPGPSLKGRFFLVAQSLYHT